MITVFSLIQRRAGLDLAGFNRHWLDPHGRLVSRFPRLRRYSQNRMTAALSPAAQALQLDGIAELTYDTDTDQEMATNSPEMAACDLDSPQFIGSVVRIVTVADVIVAPPSNSEVPKLILLFPPAVLVPKAPSAAIGQIENTLLRQRGAKSAMPVLDFPVGHITELWFRDQPALARAAAALGPMIGDTVAILEIDELRLI